MKRSLTLLMAFAIVLASCGGGADGGATDPTDVPTTTLTPRTTTSTPDRNPDEVVLQVRTEGGFMPIEFAYNTLPRYTLLADGRLLFEGPVPAIFPGPLMLSVQVAQLPDGEVARILELVEAAGLPLIEDETNTEYTNTVADAPDTVVTYFDENGRHRFSVYALGIGLDPQSDPRVAGLQRVVEALDTAAFSGAPVEEWSASSLQVIATDSFGGESEPDATVVPWPLAETVAESGAEVFAGLLCVALEGDDLTAAEPAFAAANQLTFFDDGAATYRLTVRPVLPGDAACPAG